MRLYHGSDVEVVSPQLRESRRALDFGEGFYVTSSFDQACKWAISVCGRRGTRSATVSVYEFDTSALDWLDVCRFDEADADWLEFVTLNRQQAYSGRTFDVVVGPVANDRTMTVLTLYFSGLLSQDETIERLKVQRLRDQYAFKSGRSLRQLFFLEAMTL